MRIRAFALRNTKELLRDPLTSAFALGFPLVLLALLTAIQSGIPQPVFELTSLTPGITVFGLSFMTLFSATLISRDRDSSFLRRLYTTPMTAADFIFGYTAPILPLCLLQSMICYGFAVALGLPLSINILWAILLLLPISLLYIALGLLCGSVLNDKQVGGICGALLTNVSAWLSGTWFDLALVGGAFASIAKVLPFFHAVQAVRAALAGAFTQILPHMLWVLGYAAVCMVAAIGLFLRQMKRQ